MALYTIFQMLLLASVCTYSIFLLLQLQIKQYLLMFLTLFYALFPPNLFMSISATKDSVFSPFVLLFIVSTSYLIMPKIKKTQRLITFNIILCFFSIIGCIAFRNNGKYALLVSILLLFLFTLIKKNKSIYYGKLLCFLVIAYIFSLALLSYLQSVIQCEDGVPREMMSIPAQQWARVFTYHSSDLDSDILQFMQQCITYDGLYLYNPYISDPVKAYVDSTFIFENAHEFMITYISLFISYPIEYIEAFFYQNLGFFYIFDTSHATINQQSSSTGLGYIQTYEHDILKGYKNSYFPYLLKICEYLTTHNFHLSIPVLNVIMAPGIWLYLFLFLLLCSIKSKQFYWLPLLSFLGGYYITILLGPTVQLRYIYPIMLSIPALFLFLCSTLSQYKY